MSDPGIGRVLIAALHQGIADLLPTRLEFYENWFNAAGLRHGNMGLAPLNAVLSFLRLEGAAYGLVTGRAGAYAGEWTVSGLRPVRRRIIRALPGPVRARLALRIARDLVQETYAGSRARVRVGREGAAVEIRSSIFCGVREPVGAPLCGFYAAAFGEVLSQLGVTADVRVSTCRGAGSSGCRLVVTLGRAAATAQAVKLAEASDQCDPEPARLKAEA